jgi:ABC-type Fe3+/spermidine/putrescine transport system ATPase subunit
MQAAELRLERIGKRYGDFWAARGVDLTIGRGEFFTLLGPSGCGKTTLLRIIAGFVAPDEGIVVLDGAPVNSVPPWQRDLGMVFQSYALWPHMTVFENVAFGLRERKVGRVETRARVLDALERVGLTGAEKRRPSELSGGQQQRVALARTLVVQPRALLLDEPLSNLDARLRAGMRLELLKLQRDLGITTVYVTHDQEEALALSTRIAVMDSGKVVQEGSPREIYERPRSRFVAGFVGDSNLFFGAVTRSGDGVVEILTDEGLTIRAAAPHGAAPGEKMILYVRPEAVAPAALDAVSTELNRLPGRVTAAAYQGSAVAYEIDVQGKSIRAHVVHPKTLFERGDKVAVVFDPKDVGYLAEK